MTSTIKQKLKIRALELSFKHKLSHLSSVLPAIDILCTRGNFGDKWILSNGHAGLAQYVFLEEFFGIDAEKLLLDMGIHPERDLSRRISVSTGSLGLGLPIVVGLAIANPHERYNVLVSDGETLEGSIWEALHYIEENKLDNIRVYVQCNGYGAYSKIDYGNLYNRVTSFTSRAEVLFYDTLFTDNWGDPLYWHYRVPSEEEVKDLKESINAGII